MTEQKQLIDDARRFAAQFSSFLKATELLVPLESLEQATKEAQQRLADANLEHLQARDEVRKTLKERDVVVVQNNMLTNDANEKANEIMKHAEQVLAQADVDVRRALDAAEARGKTIVTDAQKKAQQIKLEADQLAQTIGIQKTVLAGLNDEFAGKESDLTAIKSEIAALRARIGA